jgi:hypothetical protein
MIRACIGVNEIRPQLDSLFQRQVLDAWRGELWRQNKLIAHLGCEHVLVLNQTELRSSLGYRPAEV